MKFLTFIVLSFAFIANANAFGNGTKESPYGIKNFSELQRMELDPDASYVLLADIDASESYQSMKGFKPLFSVLRPFTGKLNGAGHIISNLFINRSDEDNVAFISACDHCLIENLNLKNINISGKDFSAALIASYIVESDASKNPSNLGVQNISVSGKINGAYSTGGIFGNIYNVHFLFCESDLVAQGISFDGVVTNTFLNAEGRWMGGSFDYD